MFKQITRYFLVMLTVCSCNLYAQQDMNKAVVRISGEVAKPLALTKADLSKMKRITASIKDHDGKQIPYPGVAVQQILELAGVPTGKELRGKHLTKFLLVRSTDGYRVVFSLAELDKGFNDKTVILADESMKADLPAGKGPFRIIVPGEKVLARSSFGVSELIVMSTAD